VVAKIPKKWSHPTKTLIHFSPILCPEKFKKYDFVVPHTP
jgi:hypothetical protein